MADVQGRTTPVEGAAAAGAAVDQNPVLVGGRANLNEPTAVDDGDAVYSWLDLQGRIVTAPHFPANVAVDSTHGPKTVTVSASGATALVAAPGAGQSIYVTGISITNTHASTAFTIDLQDASHGTPTRMSFHLASAGGGVVQQFSPAWKLTANSACQANLSGAHTSFLVNVHYFVAP